MSRQDGESELFLRLYIMESWVAKIYDNHCHNSRPVCWSVGQRFELYTGIAVIQSL